MTSQFYMMKSTTLLHLFLYPFPHSHFFLLFLLLSSEFSHSPHKSRTVTPWGPSMLFWGTLVSDQGHEALRSLVVARTHSDTTPLTAAVPLNLMCIILRKRCNNKIISKVKHRLLLLSYQGALALVTLTCAFIWDYSRFWSALLLNKYICDQNEFTASHVKEPDALVRIRVGLS